MCGCGGWGSEGVGNRAGGSGGQRSKEPESRSQEVLGVSPSRSVATYISKSNRSLFIITRLHNVIISYIILSMIRAKSFEDLLVWQKAHAYVLEIYRITKGFPKSELFGLTSQMRRAATSSPCSLTDGFKKRTPREKVRVLNIPQGSLAESRYYSFLPKDLSYADT